MSIFLDSLFKKKQVEQLVNLCVGLRLISSELPVEFRPNTMLFLLLHLGSTT